METTLICGICKKEFILNICQTHLKRGEGQYCSKECKNIAHSKFMKGKTSWNKGIPMSKEIKEKLSKVRKGKHYSPNTEFKKGRIAPKGKDHPSWKGGKIHRQGYKLIISPNKPRRYVFEHRYIMEQYLKRPLISNEIIHHINGIKTDNRIENLEIVLKKTHLGQVICPYCSKKFAIK